MEQAISDRPEVDEFRFELYDHLGIDQTQIDERDFIHEMAHTLYNKAHMKGSGLTKDSASEVRVDTIVRCFDGTDELCNALYGRDAKPQDYLGGSEAKMLKDAAKVVKAARCIKHWHDTGRNNEGMVVSAEHVRKLWETLPKNT